MYLEVNVFKPLSYFNLYFFRSGFFLTTPFYVSSFVESVQVYNVLYCCFVNNQLFGYSAGYFDVTNFANCTPVLREHYLAQDIKVLS